LKGTSKRWTFSGACSPKPMFSASRQMELGSFQSFAVLSGMYTTAKKLGCR